jgi:hypothetical protein
MTPFKHADHTIAGMCALTVEAAAAWAMLHKINDPLLKPSTDRNDGITQRS